MNFPMTVVFIWLGSVVPEHYKKTYENCLANYNGNCKLIGEKE